MRIDELNVISYEKFFDQEGLTKEQKEERIILANELEDVVLFILALIVVMTENDNFDYAEVSNQFSAKYKSVIKKHTYLDNELDAYIQDITKDIVSTTLDNYDTDYYLSKARAATISANETSNVMNRKDYLDAVASGKTKKQWVDIRDKRERETHLKVGGTIIGINELFDVGTAKMRYPHDIELAIDNPEEIVNCRCSVRYM